MQFHVEWIFESFLQAAFARIIRPEHVEAAGMWKTTSNSEGMWGSELKPHPIFSATFQLHHRRVFVSSCKPTTKLIFKDAVSENVSCETVETSGGGGAEKENDKHGDLCFSRACRFRSKYRALPNGAVRCGPTPNAAQKFLFTLLRDSICNAMQFHVFQCHSVYQVCCANIVRDESKLIDPT